ncbi:MAG: hypothetical protein IPM54_20205 [Polyangiaceae bacterium]|nr:hypothetical protein [Polyangiaceae bacterium]
MPMDGGYRQERPNRLTLEPASKQFVLVTERRIAHEHEDSSATDISASLRQAPGPK